ncbi:MAG: hypothetical protein KGL39_30405 [Patescibacteria group bacterium]|nr:hypothetical protein [Patescibacteria group bacterium]
MRYLSVLSYSNGFTLWVYDAGLAKQSREDVERLDFFAPCADMLRRGDMILITSGDAGAIRLVARTEAPGVLLVPLT